MSENNIARAETPSNHDRALRDAVIAAVLFVGRMSHASSNVHGSPQLQFEVLDQLKQLATGAVLSADDMQLAKVTNYAPVFVRQGLCLKLPDGSLVMSGDVGKIITDAIESGDFGSQELRQIEGAIPVDGTVEHPAIGS